MKGMSAVETAALTMAMMRSGDMFEHPPGPVVVDKLYALRDVTGTVPSIALITASIMSKKMAESLERLVLDVKYGSGAFMKTREMAQELANGMIAVGKEMGVEVSALLNPMSEPTGRAARC